jgi:hypothetical protein
MVLPTTDNLGMRKNEWPEFLCFVMVHRQTISVILEGSINHDTWSPWKNVELKRKRSRRRVVQHHSGADNDDHALC